MTIVIDHIFGYPTDSGMKIELTCASCDGKHRVTLSKIGGRFAYRCGNAELGGLVENWTAIRKQALRVVGAEPVS